jgi:hypothetical protein
MSTSLIEIKAVRADAAGWVWDHILSLIFQYNVTVIGLLYPAYRRTFHQTTRSVNARLPPAWQVARLIRRPALSGGPGNWKWQEEKNMDIEFKNRFTALWKKYFNQAELPIAFYYHQKEGKTELAKTGQISRCLIGALAGIRQGRSLTFDVDSVACAGGKKYLGFKDSIRPNFEYFLSCGIPDQMEGERYKKSPEIVRELVKNWPSFKAPGPFITFKRWDNLDQEDQPEVVIFFARNDVLSGLFTLFNYELAEAEGVIAPMSSGCASIVSYPYLQKDSPQPKAVIGMLDPSARPFVPKDVLTFSIPIASLVQMTGNMEESFLITHSWSVVQKRID